MSAGKTPDHPWYNEGESGEVFLPLVIYAGTHKLPLSTPELDYSGAWGISRHAAIREQRIEAQARENIINLLAGESTDVMPGQWIEELDAA